MRWHGRCCGLEARPRRTGAHVLPSPVPKAWRPKWGAAGRSLVSPEWGEELRLDTYPFQRWSPSWRRHSRDIPSLGSRDLN